ncbi:MAG: hypothetical protein ACP6IQ_09955 [Candidatus Njordarchaeia archaeon]|nr:hypothetical protein [Candidatus Korarchaeota archaeon]
MAHNGFGIFIIKSIDVINISGIGPMLILRKKLGNFFVSVVLTSEKISAKELANKVHPIDDSIIIWDLRRNLLIERIDKKLFTRPFISILN